MTAEDIRLRMWIVERASLYTAKYGVFSTTDIWHFLDVEHSRHAPTLKQTAAILGIMPDVEHVGRNRWRYDPGRITEDERGIGGVCSRHGIVPIEVLQDKYGQEAVRMAEANGTIDIDAEGWASLTDLGSMRMAALEGSA